MGALLYLTPTTIIPVTTTQAATVLSVAPAMNADGMPVWSIGAERDTALTTDDRVVVEYARRHGRPCPVAVGETILVTVTPPV